MECNSINQRVLYVLTNTEGEIFLGHTADLLILAAIIGKRIAIREVMYEKVLKNLSLKTKLHLL